MCALWKEPPRQLKVHCCRHGVILRSGKRGESLVWGICEEMSYDEHGHSNVDLSLCLGVKGSWICGENNCEVWHLLSDMVKWRENCLNYFIPCAFHLCFILSRILSLKMYHLIICVYSLSAGLEVEEKVQRKMRTAWMDWRQQKQKTLWKQVSKLD